MAEVNPVTGRPIVSSSSPDDKALRSEIERQESRKAKADQLAADLQTEQGSVIMDKIKRHLVERINKFIQEDGECRALYKILIEMGMDLNFGEAAANKLMRLTVIKK